MGRDVAAKRARGAQPSGAVPDDDAATGEAHRGVDQVYGDGAVDAAGVLLERQAAIVRFEPSQHGQVSSGCWSELPDA